MNGAITDPEVRTINPPSRTSHMIIGKSQNFFRSFINAHISIKSSPIMPPPSTYHSERENLGTVDDGYGSDGHRQNKRSKRSTTIEPSMSTNAAMVAFRTMGQRSFPSSMARLQTQPPPRSSIDVVSKKFDTRRGEGGVNSTTRAGGSRAAERGLMTPCHQ
jgi:hypothetical protein